MSLEPAPPALPPFLTVLEIATSGWRPTTMALVVRLGIPELLAQGPRPVGELAGAAGVVENNLYRVMRALARDGVFEERPQRTFALNAVSRVLLLDAPDSMRNMVLWLGSSWMRALWDRLGDAVRSDASVFRGLYGGDIYQFLKEHPDEGAIFHGAMVELTRLMGGTFAAAYDFSRFETVVDVGGGTGELIAAILRQHPGGRGVVFDAPELADRARETLARHGIADRCAFQAGDLREAVPPGGDAYVLKNIVHDLRDDRAVALLARCREAMRPGGAVIVIEGVIDDEGPYFQFLDLQLLLSGEGGKERTRAELEQLFAAAGLRLSQVIATYTRMSLLVGVAD